MLYSVLFFILGVAVTVYLYERYVEKKEISIQRLLPKKLEELLEECSLRISEREKQLDRELTEEEKNSILEKCYNEM